MTRRLEMNILGLGIISMESKSLIKGIKKKKKRPYFPKDLWEAGSKSYLRPGI